MMKQAIQTKNAPEAIGPYSQAVRVDKRCIYQAKFLLIQVR
mgnify:CR=1 FL=1